MSRVRHRGKNLRLACEILDDYIQSAAVEQVPDCQPSAHLRDIQSLAGLRGRLAKFPIMMVQKHKLRFTIVNAQVGVVSLRVNMAVYKDEVEPPRVIKIEESVSPADEWFRGLGDAGGVRNVREVHAAFVPV